MIVEMSVLDALNQCQMHSISDIIFIYLSPCHQLKDKNENTMVPYMNLSAYQAYSPTVSQHFSIVDH